MKRKTPYSLVDVNRVSVESIVSVRQGQALIVGVDVAKSELIACLYWPDRSFERPWRVQSPGQVGLLVATLQALSNNCPLVVAMESSGTYGDVLRQALSDNGLEVKLVSSKAVKDHAETFDGVPSQHDGKDAAVIGELCWMGKGRPWPWQERPEEDQAMRYWIRRLDRAQRLKQVYCGNLESLLARHWPEVLGLLSQSGPTLTRSLARWGDPRELASDPGVREILKGFGGRYLRDEKIEQVIAAARCTLGVRMNAWQVRELKEVAGAIVTSQEHLNLKERSSGKYKGTLSITKRGQRLVRKWLYFSALRWLREPAVKQWVARKKQRDGGKGGKAVVGVMRRLALAAHQVGKNGVEFDPARLFPGVKPPRRQAQAAMQ